MKLVVPTNWQVDLIEKINAPEVDAFYGKLDRDFVGGGRPSCVLNNVGRKMARFHIGQMHKKGTIFFYLLNSSCMGNTEWTRRGQRELKKLLDWICGIGADGIVVASPYIAQYVKKKYPHFKISVSCFANVNSVARAKFWEDLGAYSITLSHVEVNRDFPLLREIRQNTKCELQLLANDNCLLDCPMFFYHNNALSHASQLRSEHFILDYCRLACRGMMMQNPADFIRAAWIRPEDLISYEDIGIHRFKLVDRGMHTDAIALVVNAYSNRSYTGNLNDLFASPSKSLWLKKTGLFHKFKYFFHPFTVNIFKMFKRRGIVKDVPVYIDNTELGGFITHFLNEGCRYRACKDCGYCQKIADKAVKIDPEYRRQIMTDYEGLIGDVVSGDIFKY